MLIGEFCKMLIQQADSLVRRVVLGLLTVYQYVLSPWLGGSCRFVPTCSQYAKVVFSTHSLPMALWLTLWRLARCHPFCEGGEDNPPPAKHDC